MQALTKQVCAVMYEDCSLGRNGKRGRPVLRSC
jgi:hypothetical protein